MLNPGPQIHHDRDPGHVKGPAQDKKTGDAEGGNDRFLFGSVFGCCIVGSFGKKEEVE